MKDDRDWVPDATDLDWIESIGAPLPAALAAIEAAAEPLDVPIVDRHSGRVLSVLAGDRRRIVEVGTAYGYSTLWMALGQPADGTIVTIDPDRERTDLARGWWRHAGVPDDRIIVVNAPALDAIGSDPALEGPFDMVFIDADKPNYVNYYEAALPKLADDGLLIADNVLWSGRVVDDKENDESSNAIRAFNEHVRSDERVVSVMLTVRDGMTLVQKR
jgi:predicted O-methyltransferase YrrM